MNFLKFGKGT